MTLQHRPHPYRTHPAPQSPPFPLPPGCYAGRVLALEGEEDAPKILILLEGQAHWFSAKTPHPYALGELLIFEVDAHNRLIPLESLFTPSSPPSNHHDALRWRRLGEPTVRMERLKQRHRMLQNIRTYFNEQGFLEVDTPILVKAPSPESQIAPFRVGDDFLIPSPEFQMKRLLVGGFEKIYQITPCFRGKEIGHWHNPEFTLLEWYRAFERLEGLVQDLEGILEAVAETSLHVRHHRLQCQGTPINLNPPWPQRTVAELFQQHLGIDLLEANSAPQLQKAALRKGYAPALAHVPEDYEQLFFALWEIFENQLGQEAPLLVYDWPMPLASLAQQRKDRPSVAERVELYIAGIELANGFGELTDPKAQQERFEKNLLERKKKQQPPVPLDDAFLASLQEGLPPSAGMALGIDRLVMLFSGASHIREVLCFAYDEL